MSRQNLEEKAEKTLRSTDSYRVPVAIDVVAKRLNLTMQAAALGKRFPVCSSYKATVVRSGTTRRMLM
jgi:hypothetical protein